ncbi:MAG: hypothetical protein ACOYN0_16280 [Phycisphaerales bacterium]
MNTPIIARLVIKDFMIWRKLILSFFAVFVACLALVVVLHDRIPSHVFLNLGFTLLVTPTATLGIVLLMQTNVFERAKSTQHFIMSLPVTATDFTLAKLCVNIPVFTVAWLAMAITGFSFAFGIGMLPPGTAPYTTIVFLGVFVAYVGVLSVSLISQSLGVTVGAILFFDVLTPAYLWAILYIEPIGSVLNGPAVVWNSAEIGIIGLHVAAIVAAVAGTLLFQSRKRDVV